MKRYILSSALSLVASTVFANVLPSVEVITLSKNNFNTKACTGKYVGECQAVSSHFKKTALDMDQFCSLKYVGTNEYWVSFYQSVGDVHATIGNSNRSCAYSG